MIVCLMLRNTRSYRGGRTVYSLYRWYSFGKALAESVADWETYGVLYQRSVHVVQYPILVIATLDHENMKS